MCVPMNYAHAGAHGGQKRVSETGVTDVCELPCGCW